MPLSPAADPDQLALSSPCLHQQHIHGARHRRTTVAHIRISPPPSPRRGRITPYARLPGPYTDHKGLSDHGASRQQQQPQQHHQKKILKENTSPYLKGTNNSVTAIAATIIHSHHLLEEEDLKLPWSWWVLLLRAKLASILPDAASILPSVRQRKVYSLVGRKHTGALLVPSRPKVPPLLHRIGTGKKELVAWSLNMRRKHGAPLLFLLILGYWLQGFRSFPWLAMSYYLKDGLQVDPPTLQFLQSTVNLPMAAKPLYGIVSDAVYIGEARRVPYLMIAGWLQLCSWSIVAFHSGIRSSVGPLMGVLVISNLGAAIAEVANDALVAESCQKERGAAKGELQSLVWIALAVGGVVGNLCGGLAWSRISSTSMFAIFSVLVAAHLMACGAVDEKTFHFKRKGRRKQGNLAIVKEQAWKLIELVRKPEIRKPLTWFFASYAVIPTLQGSLFFYQSQYLKIHPTFLGLAKVVGQMGLMVGSLLYNRHLKRASTRRVLVAVQVLLTMCMLSDILLVSRLNLRVGIPDEIFVLGASAFVEALAQFKVLPFTVLLAQLCPAGSEGSLLAFFMSCHCLASIVSGYLGTLLASMLRISADNFTGLPFGIVVQSLSALIPLLWIACIPGASSKSP